MTTKQWALVALAVVLGGVSVYLNKDWFAGDDIHIFYTSRPQRGGFFRRSRPDTSAVNPVIFGIDRKLKLTLVKVVPVNELKTNQYPHAIWQLVSESNSPPIKSFVYGVPVPGMHPAVKGLAPEPLQPGVSYRLFIEAGSQKAQHDFVPAPRTP